MATDFCARFTAFSFFVSKSTSAIFTWLPSVPRLPETIMFTPSAPPISAAQLASVQPTASFSFSRPSIACTSSALTTS